VKVHEEALLRYAQSIVRDSDGARDIVQDAFLKYLDQRRSSQTEVKNAKAWLFRVVYNKAVDQVRKVQRHKKLEEHVKDHTTPKEEMSPIEQLQMKDRREWLERQLEQLGDREKELLQMKVFEEKSYKDIAKILNLTVGHVVIMLHRILKKLSNRLAEEPVGGEL